LDLSHYVNTRTAIRCRLRAVLPNFDAWVADELKRK